jgi:V/A-type H+-transporting ATPase subunit C
LKKTKLRDSDFLYLSAMLRAREARRLTADKISRMLDAAGFEDAVKIAEESDYRDLSGMDFPGVEKALSAHRAEVFREIAAHVDARPVVDLFRMKYDYHNIKVLVKSMGAKMDATHLLSQSGRIEPEKLSEVFISGEQSGLPTAVLDAMSESASVLSRTGNPQLADIAVDKAYYGELSALAKELDSEVIAGYVRLMTDCANLRIVVRARRTQRSADFLSIALIPGGNAEIQPLQGLPASGEGFAEVFPAPELYTAVLLAPAVMQGGVRILFERACDSAPMRYLSQIKYAAFGPVVVLTYLAALEWEITALRMILTGKLAGIAPNAVRERMRDGYV